MNIETIIFNLIKKKSHTWVRYFLLHEMQGATMPGEYVEIRSSYLTSDSLQELLDAKFNIEKIQTQQINQDAYCDVLLKRSLMPY